MTFQNFGLHPQILKAVSAAGYAEPTAIQLKAIPKIMRGFDLRASAQTGTGKTGAFLLPILDRLTRPAAQTGKGPRILILVPTRELAMQVATQAEKYSKYLHQIKTVSVFGGVPYPPQLKRLSQPYEVLIATPGRLIDLIQRSKIHFSRLEMLVLDEADRMLDMGFIAPVEKIAALTPPSRQTLLFSATMQGSVKELSEKLLNKPMDIVVSAEPEKPSNIHQSLYYIDGLDHKYLLLNHILSEKNDCSIVFTATKRHADRLVAKLLEKGFQAAALHGDMNQGRRTRTIAQLRSGKIKILVATDVASRGIDVQAISHVINFDLPRSVEDYVHRIGRTGRAGSTGTASSFVSRQDAFLVKKIEGFTGQKMALAEIAGLEPRKKGSSHKPKGKPFPRKKSRFHKRKT